MSDETNNGLISVDFHEFEFEDDAARDIVTVGVGVTRLTEVLKNADAERLEEIGYKQEHLDKIQAAFYAFRSLQQRHDPEEYRDDADAIDDDVMQEIAETFPQVAGLFGVDLELPVEEAVDPADYINLGGWEGS